MVQSTKEFLEKARKVVLCQISYCDEKVKIAKNVNLEPCYVQLLLQISYDNDKNQKREKVISYYLEELYEARVEHSFLNNLLKLSYDKLNNTKT